MGGKTANLFLHGVYYRLHGLPRVSASDRDPKFVSGFSQTLWRCLGSWLSSQHIFKSTLDMENLTERVNTTF
jgi:hypothetical protein